MGDCLKSCSSGDSGLPPSCYHSPLVIQGVWVKQTGSHGFTLAFSSAVIVTFLPETDMQEERLDAAVRPAYGSLLGKCSNYF